MECPRCHCETIPLPDDPRSSTCTNCGFTFRPEDYKQEEEVVDKMIKKVNGLRSCIVTLRSGQTITLSFPKELEQGPSTSWRSLVENEVSRLVVRCFQSPIDTVVFDDEI